MPLLATLSRLLLLASCCLLALLASPLLLLAARLRAAWARRRRTGTRKLFGFFHPYASGAGGGERVLFEALAAMAGLPPMDDGCLAAQAEALIYDGADVAVGLSEVLDKARARFGVDVSSVERLHLRMVKLRLRWAVEEDSHPSFTLIGQSLGSMLLSWEALWAAPVDVWVDTTGYAFSFAVAKLFFGCQVAAYVHYPTISTDMLAAVAERRPAHNNDAAISSSVAATSAKLLYYRLFAALYGCVGRLADVVMTNSSWTHAHVLRLWRRPHVTSIVFPPVDTERMSRFPLAPRKPHILSVGQFRPEKDHALQLRAFAALPDDVRAGQSLHLIGGCRNAADRKLVETLRELARELGIESDVHFRLNVPYDELLAALASAKIGLHTMWNEHFGIGVVEMQAAGVVTIAHNSGGPAADIVTPHDGQPTGLLAAEVSEYADAIASVLRGDVDVPSMQAAARQAATRFSTAAFHAGWLDSIAPLL